MHELSITMGIVSIVLQKAQEVKAKKVTRIDLVIGRLSGIIPECVELQFQIISRKSIAEGAHLAFIQPPAQLRCRSCGTSIETDRYSAVCGTCGETAMEALSGFELAVESIEVDQD
jgi:hydrogenase nickel incorporation protein HypA/HybF